MTGASIWIHFKYECLLIFCFYCGLIGSSDRYYEQLYDNPTINRDQFPYGAWLPTPICKLSQPSKNCVHSKIDHRIFKRMPWTPIASSVMTYDYSKGLASVSSLAIPQWLHLFVQTKWLYQEKLSCPKVKSIITTPYLDGDEELILSILNDDIGVVRQIRQTDYVWFCMHLTLILYSIQETNTEWVF